MQSQGHHQNNEHCFAHAVRIVGKIKWSNNGRSKDRLKTTTKISIKNNNKNKVTITNQTTTTITIKRKSSKQRINNNNTTTIIQGTTTKIIKKNKNNINKGGVSPKDSPPNFSFFF